jgi:cytochrome oxidase Cu insertion factor (SCO1/SenC/PrrC family)
MLRRTAGIVVVGAGCLCIAAMAASADSTPDFVAPEPGTYMLPIIKVAADGNLVDAMGKSVRLRDLTRGRITVLSFIYTRCSAPGACPAATGVLYRLHAMSEEHPSLANSLRLVSMSFDPEHDTPARLREYSAMARERAGAADWWFVTASSRKSLEPILQAYDQAVDKKTNSEDAQGPLNHTLRVYLIDHAGRVRNIYSSGTLDERLVLADIRTLLMERAAVEARGQR